MAPTIMKEICFRGSDGCELFASILGDGVPLVLLHGGGPDRRMFFPLAWELASSATVILPDIRGYGRSRCTDPSRHTWNQYARDVFALLDHLGLERPWLGGAGLGSTIAMKAAVADPPRVCGLVLISVEDIEDDAGKAQEALVPDAITLELRDAVDFGQAIVFYLQPFLAKNNALVSAHI